LRKFALKVNPTRHTGWIRTGRDKRFDIITYLPKRHKNMKETELKDRYIYTKKSIK